MASLTLSRSLSPLEQISRVSPSAPTMRLLSIVYLLALASLTSADFRPSVGVIDPDGKVHMDQQWDGSTKAPQYIACTPKAGYKCGDKTLTAGQCLQSCKGKKTFMSYLGDVTVISCDKWNGCDEKAMFDNCGCQAGEWIASKYPGKTPPSKDVKQVEEKDKLE